MLVRRLSSVGVCSNRFSEGMLGYGESPCFRLRDLTGFDSVDHEGNNETCLNMEVFGD